MPAVTTPTPPHPRPGSEPLRPDVDRVIRQVIDHAMFLIDREGRITSWNEGVGAILGWPEDDWLGRPVSCIFTEDDVRDGVPEKEMAQARETGRADDDRTMRRRSGDTFFCKGSMTAIRDDSGDLVGFFKVMQDHTGVRQTADDCHRALAEERRQREEAMRQSALLRATIHAVPDPLYIGGEHGITQCNQKALDMLGAASLHDLQLPVDELGRRFRVRRERHGELIAPDHLPFARALRGETVSIDAWATRSSGDDLLMRVTAAPIRLEGDIVGAVSITSDLTDRSEIERQRTEIAHMTTKLREREEEFRAIVHGVRDYAIFTVSVDGLISSWHIGAQLMKGYAHDEAIGMPFANLFIPEDRESGRPQLEMDIAARTGEYKGEGRRLRKDGKLFDAAVVLTALRGPTGQLLGYLKLTQDISQRKRVEAEREQLLRDAEAARQGAERANRSKSEFLATMSHELRTPLGAILGWANLLDRGLSDPAAAKHGLEAIIRNARLQVKLIEDLLDMSRIESGQLKLELQPTSVAAAVSGAVEAVLPAANAKGLAVSTVMEPTVDLVMADPARLQQIIANLLSNAVKFTPQGGSVTVNARLVDGRIEIAVADTGQGMEADFVPRAFDRFQQQDASHTRRYGGLGIGLAIVQQLAELHGGSVRAHSDGPGCGSTFTVLLPPMRGREQPQVRPTGDADAKSQGNEAEHRLSGVRLLLVDDDPDGRAVAEYALRDAGAEVVSARDAQEALALYTQHRPDAILCDIGMPVNDGFTFLRWVRDADYKDGRLTPAAAFTAFAGTDDRQRALSAGYQAHIAKPVAPADLVESVVDLIQQAIGDTARE
jgi:PAS domain S-box-containing protein